MANIRFILNNGKSIKDKTKPQMIYLRYRSKNKLDFSASIGYSVLFEDWDEIKQQVKNRTVILNRFEINNLNKNLKKHIEDWDDKNREIGFVPCYLDVRKHYDSYFTISEPKQEITLFSFIESFIEDAKTKPNVNTKKMVSSGTLRGYLLTKTFLQRFHKEVYPINFESINLEWYYDFVEWCNTQNLSLNYIGKHIKTLKTFMNGAVELKLTKNENFKSRKFIVSKEETDSIYLNLDELNQMWKLDLSKQPRKEIARDLFLIGAFTGLRVSDYNNINDKNIITHNGVKMFKIRTQKTQKVVAIPLHPIVESILYKNNGQAPKRIPDSDINLLIKEVAEDIGLDSIEYIEQTRGGLKVTQKKFKFDLVKTHTARRSFCSNAYLSGMSSIDIMSISGHKTESSFMKYIKVTPEQIATKMSQHVFFTGATSLKVV